MGVMLRARLGVCHTWMQSTVNKLVDKDNHIIMMIRCPHTHTLALIRLAKT